MMYFYMHFKSPHSWLLSLIISFQLTIFSLSHFIFYNWGILLLYYYYE